MIFPVISLKTCPAFALKAKRVRKLWSVFRQMWASNTLISNAYCHLGSNSNDPGNCRSVSWNISLRIQAPIRRDTGTLGSPLSAQ